MEDKRPFSSAEWLQTPEAVGAYIEMLEQSILQLFQSLDELKGRIFQRTKAGFGLDRLVLTYTPL
jgi:hypothetical protein